MILRVQNRRQQALTAAAGYRIRPTSFALSLFVHACGVVLLGLIGGPSSPAPKKSIYDEVIRPNADKIVWYDFRKKLPDVEPEKKIGETPKPRGREVSRRTLIADAPQPKSQKQFIWRPVPKIEIRQDLALPNIIARANLSVPAPPPEPKKIERPKVEAPPAQQPNPSPPAPKANPNVAMESPTEGVQATKVRKAFVAPPVTPRPARLTTPAPILDAPAPDPSIVGAARMKFPLPEGVGAPAFSVGAAPPSAAPPGPAPSNGNSKTDVAVASLHPVENSNAVPDGARAGRFSTAPVGGDASTGDVRGGGGITVPNLTVREDRTKPIEPPGFGTNQKGVMVLYSEKVRNIPTSTLSVPLRPSSRTIPRAIDARFQGRYVYTMVIPIENMPDYTGDWILWFAECQQQPGDSPMMRAPIPFRKQELVESSPVNPVERRLQLAAVIRKDGKVDGISVLRSAGPGIDQGLMQDLASWQFKPATRDGIAVDVDVVMEIPFNLSSAIAKRAQP